MTVGVTEGSIIATIITAHMTNMKANSAADHVVMAGAAIPPAMGMAFAPMPRRMV